MRLQFMTSISDGYVEGRVIDVARPTPQHLDWLRRGILKALPDREAETALAPAAVEQAIARRTGRGRRSPRRSPRRAARPAADASDEGDPVVPVLCPGGTVVCLGGGPSLTREDVEACRGKATVLAINDAYRLAPWADVLYGADSKWWGWHKGVSSFAGLKFSLQPDAGQWPGVQVLRNTGEGGLELDPSGLRTGRNSGYQAINLAVHLGATRVLLLGYDMGPGPKGETHWFGDHPDRNVSPYTTFLARFEAIVEPLRQLGVEVINCSRRTALTVFPCQPLEEALP